MSHEDERADIGRGSNDDSVLLFNGPAKFTAVVYNWC
jgi:hypothetical protein